MRSLYRLVIPLVLAVTLPLLWIGGEALSDDTSLFADGFERGDMSLWTTSRGIVAEPQDALVGSWRATATSTGTPASARKKLTASKSELDYATGLKILSQGSNSVSLLTLRTATGSPIVGLYVTARGKLALRNYVAGTSTVSPTTVTKGVWHRLRVVAHVAADSSRTEVWFDAATVTTLSRTTSLGTTGLGVVQIGDTVSNRQFSVAFDDVTVTNVAAPDTSPPSTPVGLTATAVSANQVDLTWSAASDDVAVTGYDIYRDGIRIATRGVGTSYSDFGVQSATSYVYQVRARDGAGNVSPLSDPAIAVTPVDPVLADPVIAAAGDIACDPADGNYNNGTGTAQACRQLATSDLLLGGQLARVLTLGDNQYENATLDKFRTSYEPTWGRVKPITSPVTGNHEYLTSGAADYFEYFGAAAGEPGQGYYSFDVGAWHLIALNSNCSKLPAGTALNGCAEGSPQNDWLEDDLVAHTNTCTLAYWHHPRFSSGEHGSSTTVAPFWTDLYAAGADVVLSGHSHNYERFMPVDPSGNPDAATGIREFVVGTGGKNHSGTTVTPPPISEVRDAKTFGVLKLTLHPTGYDWTFVPEVGATFTDAGAGTCHDAPPTP